MELSLELDQQILASQPFSRHVGARLTYVAPGAAQIGQEVPCATALGTIARMDEPNRKEQ
jgi:hypothetical protein